MSIRGAIFDLDGLLVDSEVYWQRARAAYAASMGCEWTDADEQDAKGLNSAEWADLIRRRCRLAESRDAVIEGVVARMRELYDAHLPLLPGALSAVRSLHSDLPLAVASSSPPEIIDFVLREAGIRDCFRVIASSDEAGRGKPSPDVFLLAAQRLGIAPADVVVFEDSSAGILGARAAGMAVIAVPNQHFPPSDEALDSAALVLTSLTDVGPETLSRLSA